MIEFGTVGLMCMSTPENFKFFSHKQCEYFPCHEGILEDDFNCLFCFCPLYYLECEGNYRVIKRKKIKDCSACSIPHNRYNYNYIIFKIKKDITNKT